MMSLRSSTLWKYALRQMVRRPARTLLTLVGIVLGVTTIVGVSLTIQATRTAYHEMFEAVTGRATLEVVAQGFGGFDDTIAARLETVPGIKAAGPVVQSPAALVGKSGPVPVLVLGIDPARDRAVRDYVVRKGRLLEANEAPGGLLLEAGFAESNGSELNGPVRLWTPTGICEMPIVGLLEPRGATTFNGGAVIVMPLATARKAFSLPHQVTSVQVVVNEGADAAQAKALLLAQLPAGLIVQVPGARGESAQDALYSIDQSLIGVSLAMLVAGAFVILNTFLMNQTERRRQLAILRALGVTRAQVTGLLLREATVLGFAGRIVGIGAGYLLSGIILRVMQQALGGLSLRGLHWTTESLLLAVLFGPGMTLAATWLPARRAARRAPLEDLRARSGVHCEEAHRWPPYLGLALIGVHLVLVAGLTQRWLGPAFLAPVMPVGIIGGVLAIPLGIAPLLPCVTFLLKPVLGVEGRLAFLQLARRPARTGLTVGILSIAVFAGIGVGQALMASVRDTRDWSEHVTAADFYIRGTMPEGAYAITAAVLPENLEAELGRLEGVERVDKLN